MPTKSEIKEYLEEGFKEELKGLYSRLVTALALADNDAELETAKSVFKKGLENYKNALKVARSLV